VSCRRLALRRNLSPSWGAGGSGRRGLEARCAKLATRSIKKSTKLEAIDLAISMVDLTTLEGADTPARVSSLCAKAMRPDPRDLTVPSVAAVCVYPDLVARARSALANSSVAVGVSGDGVSSGRASMRVKLLDVNDAVEAVRTRSTWLSTGGVPLGSRWGGLRRDRRGQGSLCEAHLKVILETGELVTYDNVRRASWLAMLAGADFVKTSTGKVSVNATPPPHW